MPHSTKRRTRIFDPRSKQGCGGRVERACYDDANTLDEDFEQIGIGTHAEPYKGYEESVMYTADFGVRRR